jgi:NAD(P)-dependent dehydrogenase (short-subunit alcohol dehydrogenase family)
MPLPLVAMTQPTRSVADRLRLDGRVAIVTGASKGIGAATARALAEAGARVVVSSRKQEAVDEVAHAIAGRRRHRDGRRRQRRPPRRGARAGERTVAEWGGVDVVVNNAAVNPVYGPLLDTDEAVFDKIMAVNVKGPLAVCRAAYASMKARGAGSVDQHLEHRRRVARTGARALQREQGRRSSRSPR